MTYINNLIDRIEDKPYHKISLSDINPYEDKELISNVFVMGSPGSGKTKFLQRVYQDTESAMVLESGVFDLFQEYMKKWLKEKKDIGKNPLYIEEDFDMPNIDGFYPHMNLSGFSEDETVHNAQYRGVAAECYREFLLYSQIGSGGKSGYPDWLFIDEDADNYSQLISIPGHYDLKKVKDNKSIPPIGTPDYVIYLIDPKILDYNHEVYFTIDPNFDSLSTI